MAVAKRLALDTNVLFDRADEAQFAKDFFSTFQAAGFSLEVPPTVIAELYYFSTKGSDEEQRLSSIALLASLGWGLTPILLKDIQKTYKTNFISIAQDLKLLPPKEINDLHVLAETAIAEIPALVTSDRPLLNVNPRDLKDAFDDAGLSFVSTVSPKKMLESIASRSLLKS